MDELLYMVFYMVEGLKTDHIKIFAKSAQEAADKIRAKAGVKAVFSVYLPVSNWK